MTVFALYVDKRLKIARGIEGIDKSALSTSSRRPIEISTDVDSLALMYRVDEAGV